MKAVVFSKPGEVLTVQDIDRPPTIGEHEILLRVSHCGICGSDLHASCLEGALMPNQVLGHEFSGEVIETGAAVDENTYAKGDRVTSLPILGDKGIGLFGAPGAYAEYVTICDEHAVKLPPEVDDLQGALVEPMAVGLHSVQMAGSIAQKNVLILGAGPIGLACAIWCRFFGARKIVISELSPARLEIAGELGFHDHADPKGDVAAKYQELVGAGPELQFDCVGAPGIMQQCIERAPKSGVIMWTGICEGTDSIVPKTAFWKELQIRWAVGYVKEDYEFTIQMMADGRIDPQPMVTDIISLDEVPEIFEKLLQPSDQCKVMIDPRRK